MKSLPALFLGFAHAMGAGDVEFDREIRPLFREHCLECHGEKKQKGELRLDAKVFAMKGGDNGPVIVPGDAAGSPLWQRVTSSGEERMPPKGRPLSPAQTAAIQTWLDAGAHWPENDADRAATSDKRLQHWSVQPVQRPAVPVLEGTDAQPANPINAFIRAKLAENGLKPSPEADPRTLIRRLSFDLIGLPPTPEEVETFARQSREQGGPEKSYAQLVERLLASKHHGERWARHWLDIAHYADTHGFERDQLRPNAWHYRDYVIESLNADKPYDQFLREQIAGDVLAPNDRQAIAATGFLAAGPWDFVGQVETKSDMLKRAARAGDLDDMVTQVITSTMGITINCARCHDHKLDPVTQEQYYRLWAVFAGVRRGEREIDPAGSKGVAAEKARLTGELSGTRAEIAKLSGEGLDLADMVGAGDGRGTGVKGRGIDLRTGNFVTAKLGYHRDIQVNRLQKIEWPAGEREAAHPVQWVFVPDGKFAVPVASKVEGKGVPATSGHTWDAIRNGPLNAQVSTTIDGVDYAAGGHSILGLHANSGITFDLAQIRETGGLGALRFTATVGFGAQPGAAASRADFTVFVDDGRQFQKLKMRKDESATVDIAIPATAKTLTLIATDGGDGIGSDLLFLGDARLRTDAGLQELAASDQQRLMRLRADAQKLEAALRALPEPARIYAITQEATVPVIRVQRRGNPEDAQQEVTPGVFAWARHQPADFGGNDTPEGQRRVALARWITHPDNPLTRRVLVNRLWHHHFGQGLVTTPSDFGLGGDRPSHPELLDWLADEFLRSGWSMKHIHRLIVTSAAYRQNSRLADMALAGRGSSSSPRAEDIDASNRLLWRQNPRRLDAESLRDAVLSVAGTLNPTMGGPGFRDFKYTEAYAPIYDYVTADTPELSRRSIYRFVVRTTPHQFLTTLDCPDPANLTPARSVTTTALQALTLSNNEFMLRQAERLKQRIENEVSPSREARIRRAFALTFQREPGEAELTAATRLVADLGLFALCRMLINANEFFYLD
jgi:mono/diheme cytochrome c family protein